MPKIIIKNLVFILLCFYHKIFITNCINSGVPLNFWDTLFGHSHVSVGLPSKYIYSSNVINESDIALVRKERNGDWQDDKYFIKFYSRCKDIILNRDNLNKIYANPPGQIPVSLITICQLSPDVLKVLTNGAQLAIDECKYQFRHRRWDCPTYFNDGKSLFGNILNFGIKEKAFVYAITASALSYDLTRACRRGHILHGSICGCTDKENSLPTIIPFELTTDTIIKRDDVKKTSSPPSFSFLTRKPAIFNGATTNVISKIVKYRDRKTATLSRGKSNKPLKFDRKKDSNIAPKDNSWVWGGCSDDLKYGQRISKLVMNAFEKANNHVNRMNIHNIGSGRKILKSTTKMACKCHGVSGSCSAKVCWKKLPSFRVLSNRMMEKFDGAILVDKHFFGAKKGAHTAQKHELKQKSFWITPTKRHLIYYEESPDFCNANQDIGSRGTKGRICQQNAMKIDGCDLLCCDRGYVEKNETRIKRDCKCSFKWCCRVECQACTTYTTNHYCN